MASAAILMWSIFQVTTRQAAWLSRARETGDQLLRAKLYHLCNFVAFSQVVCMMLVLCLYVMEIAPADRTLVAVRVELLTTLVSMALALSVDITDDCPGTAIAFLGFVAIVGFATLYVIGELKKYLLTTVRFLFGAPAKEN